VSDSAKDLLCKMLLVDTRSRITADDALKHLWIQVTCPYIHPQYYSDCYYQYCYAVCDLSQLPLQVEFFAYLQYIVRLMMIPILCDTHSVAHGLVVSAEFEFGEPGSIPGSRHYSIG